MKLSTASPNHNLPSVIRAIIAVIITHSEIILHFLCNFLLLVFQSFFQRKLEPQQQHPQPVPSQTPFSSLLYASEYRYQPVRRAHCHNYPLSDQKRALVAWIAAVQRSNILNDTEKESRRRGRNNNAVRMAGREDDGGSGIVGKL